MAEADEAARKALRTRQGAGARYDAAEAPHDALLLARRGTAYFARRLNALADRDLDMPAERPGQTRRGVIADICLQARALALALKGLRAPLIAEEAAWAPDPALAVTLPDRALRHLFDHTVKHLDVEWRDLPGPCWDRTLTLPDGTCLSAAATPMLRARQVWFGALDLGTGGRARDLPAALTMA